MSTDTAPLDTLDQIEPEGTGRTDRPRRSLWRIYRLEATTELLKTVRLPAYAVPVLAFPVVFYALFGLSMGYGGSGGAMATYLLGSYGTFGVIGAALFGFGVGVAVERGQGWMLLKRASPMPPGAYFAGKITVSVVFAAAIVVLLGATATLFGGVSLTAGQWLALGATLTLGALPFCAAGLFLGLISGPNSAPAVVNLIYLPTAFASGLWVPVTMLPGFFKSLAPWLPPFHLGQLAYATFGAGLEADLGGPVSFLPSPWDHLTYLVVFSILCLVAAGIAYRRSNDRLYG